MACLRLISSRIKSRLELDTKNRSRTSAWGLRFPSRMRYRREAAERCL